MNPESKSEVSPGPNRVLVVDDDAQVRRLVRRALDGQPDFMVVAEATDGAAAVEAGGVHQPDIVLLDVALLVTDGMDTLSFIARQSPNARVVMLSGSRVTNESRAQALSLGVHGYIETSGSLGRLVPHLRDLLGIEAPGSL